MIDLGSNFIINHIRLKFKTTDNIYNVQISRDNESWKTVANFSKLHCRGRQMLHFSKAIAKYIKIVVVHPYKLECNSFKVCYLEEPVKCLAGFLYPSHNIASNENAYISNVKCDLSKDPHKALLSGTFLNQGTETPYVFHDLKKGSIFIIFNQPYILASCRFRLWDFDGRKQSFKISISSGIHYKEISHEERLQKGWQTIKFTPQTVKYFQIIGLGSSIGDEFRLAYFETPARVKM